MSEHTDEQRQALYEIAEAMAPTWTKRRPFIEEVARPVRQWLLRELAPQPGETVLEVAAGNGDTGFEAAATLGDQGRLITTDLSPTMLEGARRRAVELGVNNVDFRVADAAETGLDAGSVDGVLCRFGYMLMHEPAAALAEARRVLRPDGRLAIAVWGPPERNPFFTSIAMALVQRGILPPPEPSGPGIFAMADPARTEGLLGEAGFASVRTENVPLTFAIADVETYVDVTADTAGGLGLAIQRLDYVTRKELVEELRGTLEGFATGNGYEVPAVALCAIAS